MSPCEEYLSYETALSQWHPQLTVVEASLSVVLTGDGRGSMGCASGSFMVHMGSFSSVWPLPDELPLLCHHQDHQRLHRCAGFLVFFANHRVLRLLHPLVLLKLSHFPALFTQAIIPSLIHILHTAPHTDGALQGWTDECLYFFHFEVNVLFHFTACQGRPASQTGQCCHCLNLLKNKHAVPSRPVRVQEQQPDLQNKQVGDILTN